MIWVTGDTHAKFTRFTPAHFPEMMGITKSDSYGNRFCCPWDAVANRGKAQQSGFAVKARSKEVSVVFRVSGKRSRADFATIRWPEELPCTEEYAEARRNLNDHSWAVDYIITHSPPTSFTKLLNRPRDELTDFLEEVRQKASYQRWLFGHCHGDRILDGKHQLLYRQIERIL